MMPSVAQIVQVQGLAVGPSMAIDRLRHQPYRHIAEQVI
jgi:hypothetical protein